MKQILSVQGHSRRGMLCGDCQHKLSLYLGTSHCIHCHNHWPAMHLIIPYGCHHSWNITILLVYNHNVLVLNITVTLGLVNSIIFYANIVAANSALFFPSSDPGFPSVLIHVAWLNLDTYTKPGFNWLFQFTLFPLSLSLSQWVSVPLGSQHWLERKIQLLFWPCWFCKKTTS